MCVWGWVYVFVFEHVCNCECICACLCLLVCASGYFVSIISMRVSLYMCECMCACAAVGYMCRFVCLQGEVDPIFRKPRNLLRYFIRQASLSDERSLPSSDVIRNAFRLLCAMISMVTDSGLLKLRLIVQYRLHPLFSKDCTILAVTCLPLN